MSGCGAIERDFSFFMPLEIVKSKDDSMRIGGVATDEAGEDLQGEKVFIAGLETDYLLQRGNFNWNHGKEPKDILGEIDTVDKKGQKLYVEGFLYPKVEQAEAVYKLMKGMKESGSDRKLGLSIEGKVKERNGKEIKKAWLRAVALTYDPINRGSFVDLIKSMGDFTFSSCSGDCSKCTVGVAGSCEDAQKSGEGAKKDSQGVKETMTVKTEVLTEVASDKTATKEMSSPSLSKGQESAPSPEVLKEVEKADASGPGLKAGHDIPATSGGVSGSALREEDMDKKKKVTTYDERHVGLKRKKKGAFTKSELAEWLLDKNICSKGLEDNLADFLFKAVQVAGYVRTRRGRLERVSPFTKELSHEVMRMETMSERALMGRAMKITNPAKMLHFYALAKDKDMNDLAAVIKQQGIRHLGLKERDFDDVRREVAYA